MPELYVRNDVPGALMAVASTPPASVAGQTVLTSFTCRRSSRSSPENTSRATAGEHYIKNLFPTLAELKAV